MEEAYQLDVHQMLRELWEHHWWSFEQMLSAARELDDEEFSRDLKISYGSVHGAMAHLVGTELVWLMRLRGHSMTMVPGVNELSSLQMIEDAWRGCRSRWEKVLESGDLDLVIEYSNTSGQQFQDPLWRMMIHLLDHSATYRGIIISAFRILGRTPPTTGVMTYLRQR